MVTRTGCVERQPWDTRMGQHGHSGDRYAAQVNCYFLTLLSALQGYFVIVHCFLSMHSSHVDFYFSHRPDGDPDRLCGEAVSGHQDATAALGMQHRLIVVFSPVLNISNNFVFWHRLILFLLFSTRGSAQMV